MGGGIEGFADSPFGTGQALVVDDLSQHPVVSKIVGDGNGHRPLAIVPLKVEDRMLGMMNLLGEKALQGQQEERKRAEEG